VDVSPLILDLALAGLAVVAPMSRVGESPPPRRICTIGGGGERRDRRAGSNDFETVREGAGYFITYRS
jgi:hypothetical protein